MIEKIFDPVKRHVTAVAHVRGRHVPGARKSREFLIFRPPLRDPLRDPLRFSFFDPKPSLFLNKNVIFDTKVSFLI